jgi:hypothetical protein
MVEAPFVTVWDAGVNSIVSVPAAATEVVAATSIPATRLAAITLPINAFLKDESFKAFSFIYFFIYFSVILF